MGLGDAREIGHRVCVADGSIGVLRVVEIAVRDLIIGAADVTDDGANIRCATFVAEADGGADDDTIGNGTAF